MVSSTPKPVHGKSVQYPLTRKAGWSPDPVRTLSRKEKSLVPAAVIQHESLEFYPNFSGKVEIKFCIAVTHLDIKFSPDLSNNGNFIAYENRKAQYFLPLLNVPCDVMNCKYSINNFDRWHPIVLIISYITYSSTVKHNIQDLSGFNWMGN